MFILKVGDEVGCGFSTLTTAAVHTVVKVNGHGHITLSNGEVYDKYGRARGGCGKRLFNPNSVREAKKRRDDLRDQAEKLQSVQRILESESWLLKMVGKMSNEEIAEKQALKDKLIQKISEL